MNLVKSYLKWEYFGDHWADYDEYEEAVICAYFMEAERNPIVTFDHIRENVWIEEEIRMPITSYLEFSDKTYYRVMDVEESKRFIGQYEETFCPIDNDVLQMLDLKHLFFNHYDNHFRNMPCVQVW